MLRQLPTAALLDGPICVLPAGSYIDPDVFFAEVEKFSVKEDRIWIDPNAFIISAADKATESGSDLGSRIGSTQSGTGAAVVRRVQRLSNSGLAQTDKRFATYVRPVKQLLRGQLDKQERILIEGTQGFGLSVLHTAHYPFATSRDTSAAGFLSEAGLSPLDVDEVIMVLRAYPIRVGGNSGELPHEITWQQLSDEAGHPERLIEYTSVTGKVRRIARFDAVVVQQAIACNAPSVIVLNHLDYVDPSTRENPRVTEKIEAAVSLIEAEIGRQIDFLGFGPSSIVPRNAAKNSRITA